MDIEERLQYWTCMWAICHHESNEEFTHFQKDESNKPNQTDQSSSFSESNDIQTEHKNRPGFEGNAYVFRKR